LFFCLIKPDLSGLTAQKSRKKKQNKKPLFVGFLWITKKVGNGQGGGNGLSGRGKEKIIAQKPFI